MKNNQNKVVAIFSGSNDGNGEYCKLAEGLGKTLAENNFSVVNGGGPGLMDRVAKGAFENGGNMIGIHFEFEGRKASKYNTKTIIYKKLSTRQKKIISMADAFVILPGGLGTVYELCEVLAGKFMGNIKKETPVILVSKIFWKNFLKLVEFQVSSGFIKKDFLKQFVIIDEPNEVIKELKR